MERWTHFNFEVLMNSKGCFLSLYIIKTYEILLVFSFTSFLYKETPLNRCLQIGFSKYFACIKKISVIIYYLENNFNI
jgi:hypothetical protein